MKRTVWAPVRVLLAEVKTNKIEGIVMVFVNVLGGRVGDGSNEKVSCSADPALYKPSESAVVADESTKTYV